MIRCLIINVTEGRRHLWVESREESTWPPSGYGFIRRPGKKKTAILNEFFAVCKYHRKHPLRLLNQSRAAHLSFAEIKSNEMAYNDIPAAQKLLPMGNPTGYYLWDGFSSSDAATIASKRAVPKHRRLPIVSDGRAVDYIIPLAPISLHKNGFCLFTFSGKSLLVAVAQPTGCLKLSSELRDRKLGRKRLRVKASRGNIGRKG